MVVFHFSATLDSQKSPLPLPPGEGWGEGIKLQTSNCMDAAERSEEPHERLALAFEVLRVAQDDPRCRV